MEKSAKFRFFFTLLPVFACIVQCGGDKKKRDNHPQNTLDEVVPPTPSPTPPRGKKPSKKPPKKPVPPGQKDVVETDYFLLAPEEVISSWALAFGKVVTPSGATAGVLVKRSRPSLGGIDFAVTFDRDPRPNATTLLSTRSLCAQLSAGLIKQVLDDASDVFDTWDPRTHVFDSAHTEVPDLDAWNTQLRLLYLKLLSRPPSSAEVTLIETTFSKVAHERASYAAAWQATLFSLCSTAEAWHR